MNTAKGQHKTAERKARTWAALFPNIVFRFSNFESRSFHSASAVPFSVFICSLS